MDLSWSRPGQNVIKQYWRWSIASALGVVFSVPSVFCAENRHNFPHKPITLVVGYPAGGSTDMVARTLAKELGKRLKQSIVVENVGGAGGVIGTQKVINAVPDGHTLLIGTSSEIAIARLTNPNVKYDGRRELVAVAPIAIAPMVFVAGPKLKVDTLDEFKRFAKANPGQVGYASAGVGTPLHLAGEMISQRVGINMLHVPYRGAGQMAADLIGGRIETAVFMLSSALPHIRSGSMRAFGVTQAKRSPVAPDIAALAEIKTFAGVDLSVFYGLFAPAKTPDAIVAQLGKELAEVLKAPDVVARLTEGGLAVSNDGSLADFSAFIEFETEKYREIISSMNSGSTER